MNGVRPLSSVVKTLGLLDVLGSTTRPMRLVDVARTSRMSRATAYQKLLTLIHAGWAEQTEQGYRLTLHATRLGQAALEQASLGDRVIPFLEKLVAQSGETASLAVLEGAGAHIVQRVESTGVLRAELHIGAVLDLAESASGRVLLAFADEAVLQALKKQKVAIPDAKLLAQVRRDSFATSSGRLVKGVRAIAAPIFDRPGRCIAALSLVGPLPRFSVDKLRPALLRSADRINAFLKGEPP
jgi:DNA-binding IclR family transcriptional regulator